MRVHRLSPSGRDRGEQARCQSGEASRRRYRPAAGRRGSSGDENGFPASERFFTDRPRAACESGSSSSCRMSLKQILLKKEHFRQILEVAIGLLVESVTLVTGEDEPDRGPSLANGLHDLPGLARRDP